MKSVIERWRALRLAWGAEGRLAAAELRYRRHRSEAPRLDRASPTVALRIGPEGTTSCHGCEYCVRVCPAEALRVDIVEGEDVPRGFDLDPLRCVGCGLCDALCPADALAPQEAASPILDRAGAVTRLLDGDGRVRS